MKIEHKTISFEFICDKCNKKEICETKPESWFGMETEEGINYYFIGKEKKELSKGKKQLHFCSYDCYNNFFQEKLKTLAKVLFQ